jgi:DNA-binding response OmpR family regulator
VDSITVLLVEPDATLRTRFEHILVREADLLLVSRPDFLSERFYSPETRQCDVLLLDADRTPVTDLRIWAKIHVVLADVHIVALTAGHDDAILEAVLAGGINSVQRTTVEPVVLCRVIRNAAQGIIDSDRELIDRAKRAILQPLADVQVRFGGLTIDLRTCKVTRWNRPIHLTPLEFQVIAYLAHRPDRPVSLNELLAAVWSASPEMGGTLAQVHCCIQRLRQKIEPDPKHPRYLLSERGWGYWLQDPTAMATTHLPSLPLSPDDELLPELIATRQALEHA